MTPLILIVGFLGAGKTTLLRDLVPLLKAGGITPHVVINDYQNARVDASLLSELTEIVYPISGSCVCCGSQEELIEALEGMPLNEKSILLIECNGTTDSEELIEFLAFSPRTSKYTLPIQISVIDAQRWQKRYWHNLLEAGQVKTATHLLITRTDKVDSTRLESVISGVKQINHKAVAVTAETFAAFLIEAQEQSIRSSTHIKDFASPVERDHHHDASVHHFTSMEVRLPDTLPRQNFLNFLRELPRDVIRAKGIVEFSDDPGQHYVFQHVGSDNLINEPSPGSTIVIPISQNTGRRGVAIFVGVQLPEAQIRIRLSTLACA